MNNLVKDALLIPVSDPRQTISISPVVLEVEDRPIPSSCGRRPATGNSLAGHAQRWARTPDAVQDRRAGLALNGSVAPLC